MSNELYEHKRSDTVKWILTLLAFILVGVMLAGIIASRLIFNKRLFKKDLHYESQFAFIFNNATFLGYPIISHAFGEAIQTKKRESRTAARAVPTDCVIRMTFCRGEVPPSPE